MEFDYMKKRLIIIFMLMTFFLNSQENLTKEKNDSTTDITQLTMDDCISLALKNNLNIETEKLKLEKKKWALITCWNVIVPQVKFSVAFNRLNDDARKISGTTLIPYNDPNFANPFNPKGYNSVMPTTYETTLPEWGLGFNFSLQWVFTASLFLGMYQTVLDYQNGKISVETAKRKLIKDIKKTYKDLLLKERYIRIKKDELSASEKRLKQAEISYKNGLIPEYQLLSARVSYENLKPQLLEYINNYEIALIQFKQTLGLKSDVKILLTETSIESEKKDFDYKELINKYLSKRLDFQSLDITYKQKINARNVAISSLTPNFILSYTIDPTFQYDLTKYDDWKDKSIEDLWKQRSGVLVLSFSIPISAYFPFSSEQMKIVNSNYDIKMAQIDREQKIQNAEVEIQQLVSKLDKSRKQIEFLKLNVELAEKSYKLAEEAYRAGTRDLLDVEDAQNKLNTARYNLLKEEYNYTINLLDLEYALEVGSTSSMGGMSMDFSSFGGMDPSMMMGGGF